MVGNVKIRSYGAPALDGWFSDAITGVTSAVSTWFTGKSKEDASKIYQTALTKQYEQQKQLYNGVSEDYSHLTTKKKRYEAVREDPYFNALQLKYANAITCHKSQGGQWSCVFVDNPFWQEELTIDDLKWLYTALTRAVEKVYLVNFKDEYFNNK